MEEKALEWVRSDEVAFSLRAPSQTGKTSLLHRMVTEARRLGRRTAIIDAGDLAYEPDINSLFQLFLELVQSRSGTTANWVPLSANWVMNFGPMLDSILGAAESPLLVAVDNTEQLIDSAVGEQFFQKLRSLIQESMLNRRRFRLILMTSVHPSRLIKNVQVSPFNGVGTHEAIEWGRWNLSGTRALNRLYGGLLSEAGLAVLREWVGGHPFLTQTCLQATADAGIVPDDPELLAPIWRNSLAVRNHLSKLAAQLDGNERLNAAFQQVLEDGCASKVDVDLLEMMGLAKEATREFLEPISLKGARRRIFVETEPTCKLYRQHFCRPK
jgi:hypothetical protein